MATKIIIKNSSVPDKEPDAGALERGELAINLADRKLYTKDVNDEVFSFDSAGQVPSGGTGDRPLSPDLGDVFFDTDLNALVFWNGTSWEQITSETPGGNAGYVKLDDGGFKQVIKSAGLGISDSNIEKITLKPTGDATFVGAINAGASVKAGGVNSGDAAILIGGNSITTSTENVGPATLTINTNSTIDHDGNATFAGKVQSASTVETDPDKTLVTKDYIDGPGGGGVPVDQRFVKLDDTGTKQVIKSAGLGLSDGTTENITLSSSGSGTFAGNVGNTDFNSGNGYRLDKGGAIYVRADSLPATSEAVGIYRNGNAAANAVTSLKHDGSANFVSGKFKVIETNATKAYVNLGDEVSTSDFARSGVQIVAQNNANSTIKVQASNAVNSTAAVFQVIYDNSTPRITFTAAGSAIFDSKVTAGTFDLESLQELP